MKHFTVRLSVPARQTRQWSIWADTLTVGSDPRCALVLPAPVAPRLGAFLRDAILDLPFGRLEVLEDTPDRLDRWEDARARIARARLLECREPGEQSRNARAAVLAGMGFLSLVSVLVLLRIGNHPLPRVQDSTVAEFITLVIPEEKKDPPPPPDPVDQPSPQGSDQPDPDPNQGGRTESSSVAWPPQTPASVMERSVMSQISTSQDGLIGNDILPDEPNAIDVILTGGGGTLAHGNRGGLGASGDGDRMAAVGGIGLGNGGRNGFGAGHGSTPGSMRLGTTGGNGTGVALRTRVTLPKPTDIDMGGDAGSRSPESILRVIRQNMGGFRYVYEKYLRDNPGLGGKISLRFTIAPSGDILQIAVVASNTGNDTMDENVKDQAKKMKFDSIDKGNVTVTYAFLLDHQ